MEAAHRSSKVPDVARMCAKTSTVLVEKDMRVRPSQRHNTRLADGLPRMILLPAARSGALATCEHSIAEKVERRGTVCEELYSHCKQPKNPRATCEHDRAVVRNLWVGSVQGSRQVRRLT